MRNEIWDFTLLDTGFFRSGQPFHAGEGGHSRINSCFPPPMNTLQGAIRSTLAAANGWRPGLNWPEELGDSDCLGSLSLKGPFLITEGKPLFPAPLNLLIKELPEQIQRKNRLLIPLFWYPVKNTAATLVQRCLYRKKKGNWTGLVFQKTFMLPPKDIKLSPKWENPTKMISIFMTAYGI